jgi:hypothetical protein
MRDAVVDWAFRESMLLAKTKGGQELTDCDAETNMLTSASLLIARFRSPFCPTHFSLRASPE